MYTIYKLYVLIYINGDIQVYRKRKQNVAMDTDEARPIKIRNDAICFEGLKLEKREIIFYELILICINLY